jgi:putative transposase
MRQLDELFTAWPSRRAANGGHAAGGRSCDQSQAGAAADAKMSIAAFGPKPRTTKPAPGHKIFPYLLCNVTIHRPKHVRAAGVTHIPIGRGFLYLVVVIDRPSRAVLA